MRYDLLIIGGGASGLAAAVTARSLGIGKIAVLEKLPRVGKKILATGNGKCNLSHERITAEDYRGSVDTAPILDAFGDVKAFFVFLGLYTRTDDAGRMYPYSMTATAVLDALRLRLREDGTEEITETEIVSLRRENDLWCARAAEQDYFAPYVIFAAGGYAAPKLGTDGSAWKLLQKLGIPVIAPSPNLCPVLSDAKMLRSLKGLRVKGEVTLYDRDDAVRTEVGEVQFTEKGVSGPAAFDLARAVSTGGEGLTLVCDLLRGYAPQEVLALLQQRQKTAPHLTAEDLLTGALHNRLGKTIIRYVNLKADTPVPALTRDELRQIARACKGFTLPVRGTEGFAGAQVTAGGIRCAEFDPRTMQSRLVPGLYACGEVLDIDGDCGGFNLQWAWSSGRIAGRTLA